MTTRNQIIADLEDAKHGHYKDCYALETGDDTECNCPSKERNAAIDAAIAWIEKPEAVQAGPVAYSAQQIDAINDGISAIHTAHQDRCISSDGCKCYEYADTLEALLHPAPKPADVRMCNCHTCGRPIPVKDLFAGIVYCSDNCRLEV